MILFKEFLPRLNGNIRFLHAIPDAPSIDIYANGKLLHSNLAFGKVTDYISISPEKYTIQLYKSGTYDSPLISEPIDVLPNTLSTINITYENNEIAFFEIDDVQPETNPLLSFVRFINLSPDAQLLSLSLPDGRVLFNQASYLETNEYYPLSPGIYNFIVSSSEGNLSKFISNIDLKPNIFITIYIIGLKNGTPQIGYMLIKDNLNK